MATTVHKNLTGSDLHEPKGADTALSGQVYVSDGSGSGAWVSASSVITNTAFTTGDLKPTHKATADTGWILWSDGTIGDGSSGASIRFNADTAALFALYWNNYSNTLCPVSGGRGVSAVADYAAHKTIAVPIGAGRVLGLTGSGSGLTARTLGSSVGGETVVLSNTNLPPYTPAGSLTVPIQGFYDVHGALAPVGVPLSSAAAYGVNNASGLILSGTFTGTAQGGTSTPVSIVQPTSFVNIMIKL